jgi:endonuclease/exonuclease/phosphatase family metal-dependent hydrolase
MNIVTYNIHKGYSQFNRRVMLHELRERLRQLNADIVFLQEVRGAHDRIWRRQEQPQHEFLAHDLWPYQAYGMNAVYDGGHHGNAILSHYPIVRWENQDISAHGFESRGALHCELALPGHAGVTLHCLCVHLGLFKRGRGQQFRALIERVNQSIPATAPLIIAGDFNDWNNHASRQLARELNLQEVFESHSGRLARSFPAGLPLLRLDRIYVRGLKVRHSGVHAHLPWDRISDHAALAATLEL